MSELTEAQHNCEHCHEDEHGKYKALHDGGNAHIAENPWPDRPDVIDSKFIIWVDGEAMIPIEFCPKCGREL